MAGFVSLEVFEEAPRSAGLNIVIGAAVAVSVLSFLDLPGIAVVLILFLATAALVGGLLLHLATIAARRQRIQRHRRWLKTQPAAGLLDFRSRIATREEDVERTRQDWIRPLIAALAVSTSAVIVPYQMLSSFAPAPMVEPANGVWAVLMIALGATCALMAVLAARRQEYGPDHAAGDAIDPRRRADV